MHHALAVRVVERVRHVGRDRAHALDGQRALASETRGNALAIHERHDEVDETLDLVDREDRNDVRVSELRGHLRFA